MKKIIFIVFSLLALILVGCSSDNNSEADPNYPSKPVTILQGFEPGGGSDQLAQLTHPYVTDVLDTTFNNEYNPGAAGAVAWTKLANKVKPDGYTISITNSPMLMTNYIMNDSIDYTLDDFDPIANIVTDPGIIVVSPDSQFETYEDFEKELKNNKVNASHSGVGGDDFFTILKWMRETNLEVEMIPYDGDGPSWQAAAGGDVDVSFNNVGVVYPQIEAGNLKPLVVFTEERLEMLPDVPTAKEFGIDVVSGSSRGYSGPKGIPEEIKEKLYEAFEQLKENDEFLEGLDKVALPVDIMTGEEYKKFLENEEKLAEELWDEVKDQYEQ